MKIPLDEDFIILASVSKFCHLAHININLFLLIILFG